MKNKTITLTAEECAAILVGLNEFSFILDSKPDSSCLKVYEKINEKLIEKFRQIGFELATEN